MITQTLKITLTNHLQAQVDFNLFQPSDPCVIQVEGKVGEYMKVDYKWICEFIRGMKPIFVSFSCDTQISLEVFEKGECSSIPGKIDFSQGLKMDGNALWKIRMNSKSKVTLEINWGIIDEVVEKIDPSMSYKQKLVFLKGELFKKQQYQRIVDGNSYCYRTDPVWYVNTNWFKKQKAKLDAPILELAMVGKGSEVEIKTGIHFDHYSSISDASEVKREAPKTKLIMVKVECLHINEFGDLYYQVCYNDHYHFGINPDEIQKGTHNFI